MTKTNLYKLEIELTVNEEISNDLIIEIIKENLNKNSKVSNCKIIKCEKDLNVYNPMIKM